MKIKKIMEAELLDFLEEDRFPFAPLQVTELQRGAATVLTLRWGERSYRFAVETKRLWTPKAFSEAVAVARGSAGARGLYPLVLTPYLGEEQLLTLESQGVSGIDLCGNGVVIVPGELLVLRTGLPNCFRWEGTIKNVYRKSSSVVARTFLLVPEFGSVKKALAEIRRRGGEVSIGTISKVCKGLESDLVIERGRGDVPVALRLRLLQPEKLLDLLAKNYVSPEVKRLVRGKSGLAPEELRRRLAEWQKNVAGRVVLTGASSVEAYAVMAREPVQSFYCSDVNSALGSLGSDFRETDRFANVAFQQTGDGFVYFDRRPDLIASPIQSYLELANGDPRERETAEQVRRVILGQLGRASSGG